MGDNGGQGQGMGNNEQGMGNNDRGMGNNDTNEWGTRQTNTPLSYTHNTDNTPPTPSFQQATAHGVGWPMTEDSHPK